MYIKRKNGLFAVIIASICIHVFGTNSLDQIRQYYTATIEQESQEILDSFIKTAGITHSEFYQEVEKARQLRLGEEKEMKKVNDDTYGVLPVSYNDLINRLAKEQGIHEQIELINNNGAPEAFACAVAFGPRFFSSLPEDEREAVLMHEMVHILKNDTAIRDAMLEIFQRSAFYKKPLLLVYMQRMRIFREKRADILAVLTNPDRAQALRSFFNRLNKSFTDIAFKVDSNYLSLLMEWVDQKASDTIFNFSHPSLQTRVDYLTELINRIQGKSTYTGIPSYGAMVG